MDYTVSIRNYEQHWTDTIRSSFSGFRNLNPAANWRTDNCSIALRKVLITIGLVLVLMFVLIALFTMIHTNYDVDHCAQTSNTTLCLNGAICKTLQHSYHCTCTEGFTGENCEYSLCAASEKSSRENLQVVSVGCGGLISIPDFPAHNSFLLDYKGNVTYKNEEQCLWTLDGTVASVNFALKIKVRLLCEGFENSGGAFSVVQLKHKYMDYVLSYNELNSTSSNYESTDWEYKLILNYYASGSEFGAGFLVLISVIDTSEVGFGSNFVFTTSSGSQMYAPTKQVDCFSMVVNPQPQQNTTVFTVDYLDSKHSRRFEWVDQLDIYEIRPTSPPIRLARLSQSFTSPRNYIFKYPILATFQSHDTITGNGMKFSWK